MGKFLFRAFFIICLLFSNSANAVIIKSDEINRLKSGQVLQTSLTKQLRKGLKGSESKILIDAPVEKVWEVIDNKENLPKFIPQVKNAKVIEENADIQKVDTTIELCKLLPTFKYNLLFDMSEKYRRMKFKKTGGAFKELFGYFETIPYGEKTIFAYRVYSDPGFYIPEVISQALRGDAKEIMKSIKREAERD